MIAGEIEILATCVPGLEDVAAEEIGESLGALETTAAEGKVRFRAELLPEELFGLRSVEYLHVFLREFHLPWGGEAEAIVTEEVSRVDLEPYLRILATRQPLPPRPSFRITGQREGSQSWTSMDLQRWAGQAIVDRWKLPVDLEGHDLDIVVRAEGESCWVAGRLHRESLRRRSWGRRLHPAALNPLIAYGMVRLASPRGGEAVLDPFCGSGTLLIEGALREPGARWHGADHDPAALAMARDNARAADVELQLLRADARHLPAEDGSVGLLLGNLPFGRRSGSHTRNRHLYGAFFAEVARILSPGGRAVLLTLERRLVERVLSRTPLRAAEQRVISHSGLRPRLYVLRPE
jgi:putative N6-adenine-specific DNA methylase/tRNA (guanine6-N2)-methyltransferase